MMGSWNGWWLRVVGLFCFCLESGVLMIPICGMSSIRAFVVSVFRGVGGNLCVYFRVVCGFIWMSQ